jgi:restriction endonuclease S subunit
MLKNKIYTCDICKTKPDQLSHHKTHLETQKHKYKKELFELKLSKLTSKELQKLYNTTDINIIIDENETNTFIPMEDKKLINTNLNDNEYNINKEMSDEDKQKMEKSQNVSNKEALKDKIHEIHNYLRNNGAGYGMNALKVFNLLYGLKKIEEKKLLDKVNLKRPDCEFSHLLKLANENKDEDLAELILGSVSTSIYHSNISDLLFYEIPTNIKSSVFAHLIKEINKITIIEKTCNVLLSGKIYEYFIGRDESAISELGAYFTDRHIVDYIYEKLDPNINEDGSIDSMIDMFGGSGGFTTGYINYLNNKYDDIDWKNNINKIYHFDMNEDVIKSAGLEFFCLTGVLPNMKDNLKYKNSFTDEFNNKKFNNVITNPPYGGDKVSQSDAQIKRKKVKDYIKKELETLKDELTIKTRMRQLKKIEEQEKQEKKDLEKTKVSVEMCSQRIIKYAKDNKLSGNDKESSSLILIMDMVDVNGTAIGVLKEGVFFNKTYKDIRKCLVENFNVREIISVPQDQFENTSTKTSIVIFDNTKEKTSIVKFSELIVEKYTEDKFEEITGEIVLTESKDDISSISDKLISEATIDEILKNPICSLNGKDYNKKTIVCGKDYELKKLGDICDFLQKSKRKASDGKNEGKYNFYTSSDKVQKCDFVDYKDECIIIGSGGVANIKMDKNFSCSADNFIITSKYNQYIFNFLKGNMNFLSDGFTGSTLKHISKDYLKNLEIPIPKDENKIKEWVDKISKPYDKVNENEQKIKELEGKIKNRIKEISEKEECEEVELGSICDINPESLKKNQFSQINYIDISSVKEGKINNIQLLTENFPSRAQRIIKKNDILFSTVRPNLKGYTFISDDIKNGVATSGFAVIRSKLIHPKYIYSLITDDNIIDFLMKNSTGTSYPAVNSSIFGKIKIKIPKNKKLIQKLEPLFEEIEKLQSEMKEAELQYKQFIKELSDEAIPNNKQEIKIDDKFIELSDETEEKNINIEEPNIETTKKSKVSTKKDKPKSMVV